MFDFGFGYCKRLYNQINNIYQIKKYIDIIFKEFECDNDNDNYNDSDSTVDYDKDIKQNENFESLKQIIFSCGSLYIKFFQWYISKLKSNNIDINKTKSLKNANRNSSRDSCTDSCTDSETGTDTESNVSSDTDVDSDKDINIYKSVNLSKFINYFEDIFEQCPYHDIEHTKTIFSNSMNGIELDNYIDISTFKVIASGSIGQVYYAKRKTDNLEIAIKVKHPNISEDLDKQYEIILFIKLIQKIPFLRNYYNLYFNIDDFLTDINLQCDFNNEANNCKIFQENFKDSANYIVFPKIIYQSSDLLISEYIDGESFENLKDMQKYQTTINFMCFFYQMLLVDNFLHGDLHCKNWKVRQNKETNIVQIVVYDCGICFQNTSIELTNEFWFSLINYDIEGLNKTLLKFINETNYININKQKIEEDINIFFNNILIQSIDTSIVIKSIVQFFRSNDIIVNKFLLNLSILICVIEEFLKKNSLIDKDKHKNLKRSSMFEIINESQLDIIAFCDVKKCYPKIKKLFSLDMKNKYTKYKTNIMKNNITEVINTDNKLFSSLSLSTLTFRPPE